MKNSQNQSPSGASGLQHLLPFKYMQQISVIKNCPPQALNATIDTGYRFAFDDIADRRNFLPVALIDPSRMLPGKPVTACCEAFSLSMFTTLTLLEERVRSAKKNAPNLMKRLGTHYTALLLTPACGNHTAPSKDGHFEFFERQNFNGPAAVLAHARYKP